MCIVGADWVGEGAWGSMVLCSFWFNEQWVCYLGPWNSKTGVRIGQIWGDQEKAVVSARWAQKTWENQGSEKTSILLK